MGPVGGPDDSGVVNSGSLTDLPKEARTAGEDFVTLESLHAPFLPISRQIMCSASPVLLFTQFAMWSYNACKA